MSELALLPYLRRGLARHAGAADPRSGPLGPASVAMGLTVAGSDVSASVGLLGPQHVASLDPGEIVRRYPAPGAVDVETNYFPLIELRAPDLPWRYTPARAAGRGRLRPWLALVVVEADADGVTYMGTTGATGLLRVEPGRLHQLPPAGQTWGWAHVQSSRPFEEVAAAVEDEPEALRARLVCPRLLQPGVRYRAALVNAFAAGAGEVSEPAWADESEDAVDLVVHDTWTFTTAAEAGDFESLCELLLPATEVGELGVRAVDVTEPGLEVDWPRRPIAIDLVGALADPGVITDALPAGNAAFAGVVEPILDDVLARAADEAAPREYDALRDDPVVGLPFYGSWPAGVTRVPGGGWARALNVRTDRRIAAGLGARTVRRNQESLMAAAWEQLGAVREVGDELNRGRLAAEVGRAWQARLADVESGDRLALASPLLAFMRVDGVPAREAIAGSRAPVGTLERAWIRRTPRARGAAASAAFVRGSAADAGNRQLRAFDYQAVAAPEGTHAIEVELQGTIERDAVLTSGAIAHVDRTGLATQIGGDLLAGFVRGEIVMRPEPLPAGGPLELAAGAQASARDVAAAVSELDPLAAARAAVVARAPSLTALLPDGELPAGLELAPEFTDALYWDLAELDADVIVPGLGEFPLNRVRLLAVNGGFVGAYMAGANHELAREFLWREYPADLTATYFRRFFDYEDAGAVDIDPIDDWPRNSTIGDNVTNADATTVILIRGDVVRRYPDMNVFLAPQGGDRKPQYEKSVQPSFEGRLGADVLVVGFPRAPEVVLGQTGAREHFVVLEERMVAPRFGLDVSRRGALTTWDELALTDFPDAKDHIRTGAIAGLASQTIDGVEWGRNAAHLAAATHQRPFRRLFPATRLVGS
jgi:hypothetical protein